jgi:hypothetical protein
MGGWFIMSGMRNRQREDHVAMLELSQLELEGPGIFQRGRNLAQTLKVRALGQVPGWHLPPYRLSRIRRQGMPEIRWLRERTMEALGFLLS